MKELSGILQACALHPEKLVALATLVKASGSTYRRPGARMLVLADGQSIGTISGGCLERAVADKSQEISPAGEPVLQEYDTSSEEDIVFGAGLGCKGTVDILIEPVRPDAVVSELFEFLAGVFQTRTSGCIATIFKIQGDLPTRIGDRLFLNADGNVSGNIKDATLKSKLLHAAQEGLNSNRSKTLEFQLPCGTVEALVEVIHAPAPLVIFGAGYDAIPLARIAKEIGFHVTVADIRPAYAQPSRFPEADAVVVVRPEEIATLHLTQRTSAVIMSHNYSTDGAFLKALLPLPLRYLGLMGPKARAMKMLQELRNSGFEAGENLAHRIHNPVGLDIGAENSEQIALAILAEIQAVISGRPGGLLREKKGPIHAPAC